MAACATAPTVPPAPGGFAFVGRFAVRHGEEAATGRVTWRHSDATDDLILSTPLGQGVAEITRRDGTYTLVTSQAQRHTASDPDQLTEQVLGWTLPLAGLADCLQG